MKLPDEYSVFWRGFLRNALKWPESYIADFVSQWQRFADVHGQLSITHDSPFEYVAPLCIHAENNETARTTAGLKMRICSLLETAVAAEKRLDDVDWNGVRILLEAELAKVDRHLPTPEAAYDYWKERRQPQL